ncbi:MAG: hypothetical protein H0U89_09215 [Acidimicrobiia bacterium]|nr:hypothetical protein [Acidimicrobiia bacterium]
MDRSRRRQGAHGALIETLPAWLPSAAIVVLVVAMGWQRRFITDDGLIYTRVVHQLLDGEGPVFNAGERVETYASPLWLAIVACAKAVFSWSTAEWLSVLLGLAMTALGVAAASFGAASLAGDGRVGRRLLVPFGSLVVACLPPFWDFTTSGLETGLEFAWLGGSFATLAASCRRASPARSHPWMAATLLGVGPLVRPDFAIFSATFLMALVVVSGRRRPASTVRLLLVAAAPATAYQVFRMGYFAALVPNTALAKEASSSRWGQGWRYAVDLLGPYWLWLPMTLVGGVAVTMVVSELRDRRWGRGAVLAAPMVGAILYGAYVVRLGGDFMHGRMLLPAVFAAMMPLFVVEFPSKAAPRTRSPVMVVAAGAVVLWAAASGLWLRPVTDDFGGTGTGGIEDQRVLWQTLTGQEHPVVADDYAFFVADMADLGRRAGDRRILILRPIDPPGTQTAELPLVERIRPSGVVTETVIGARGVTVGRRVHVVDLHGLADPIASRLVLTRRGHPGHEKILPLSWVVARFADPSARSVGKGLPRRDQISAARAALRCSPLRDLLDAVETPLTPSRVLRNIWRSVGFTRQRIPVEPSMAEESLCGP